MLKMLIYKIILQTWQLTKLFQYFIFVIEPSLNIQYLKDT